MGSSGFPVVAALFLFQATFEAGLFLQLGQHRLWAAQEMSNFLPRPSPYSLLILPWPTEVKKVKYWQHAAKKLEVML